MSSLHEPVACTLTPQAAANQLGEWSDLRTQAIAVEARPAGAMMRFPVTLEPLIEDLVRREAACCAFLEIITTHTTDELIVEFTSPNPDALPVLRLIAGLPTT